MEALAAMERAAGMNRGRLSPSAVEGLYGSNLGKPAPLHDGAGHTFQNEMKKRSPPGRIEPRGRPLPGPESIAHELGFGEGEAMPPMSVRVGGASLTVAGRADRVDGSAPAQLPVQGSLKLLRGSAPGLADQHITGRQIQHPRRDDLLSEHCPAFFLQSKKVDEHLQVQSVADITEVEGLFPGLVSRRSSGAGSTC